MRDGCALWDIASINALRCHGSQYRTIQDCESEVSMHRRANLGTVVHVKACSGFCALRRFYLSRAQVIAHNYLHIISRESAAVC